MVTGWLTRLVVIFALIGVVAFDGISVLSSRITVGDDAQTVAQAAATTFHQQGTSQAALLTAQQTLPHGDTIVPGSFRVAVDGTVSIQLRRTAKSLLLHDFSQTRRWAIVTGMGSARSTA